MLDTTLATEFVPGTNLKGDVTGANWTFLLPSLELGQVVCIGSPPATTLTTLSRLSHDVAVLGTNSQQLRSSGEMGRRGNFSNVQPIATNGRRTLPLADDGVDLILVASAKDARQLAGDHELGAELRRVLKPEGLIYFESGGPLGWLRGDQTRSKIVEDFGGGEFFWLTPLSGEMHTAVPLHDRETIHYFLRHRLYSPTVTPRTFKRVKRWLNGRRSAGRPAQQSNVSAGRQAPDPVRPSKRRLSPKVREVGAGLLRALEGAERFVNEHGRWMRRSGVLAGRAATDLAGGPPAYLQTIARDADIDVSRHRWGLSAPGDYSSRKVLFFLFEPESRVPEYVVKLTRDPAFNPRLENEYRALSLLQERGFGDPESLPRPAFFGYHKGLAVVGETVIDGAPFRQQTQATADCPYAGAAIDWLVELGAATADPMPASPAQVAAGLETLFNRFTEIYRLTSAHRDFLAEQIRAIAHTSDAFPVVFQHGDPGTWNMMVAKSGRVAFLDWEAAEPHGMPLWDLFYFLRSYSIWVARANGTRARMRGFAQHFLAESPLGSLIIESVERYCEQTGLAAGLVEPLFYTCWMHRALKESTRLTPAKLDGGHYVNLLRLCIERRDAPTLRRLFTSPSMG